MTLDDIPPLFPTRLVTLLERAQEATGETSVAVSPQDLLALAAEVLRYRAGGLWRVEWPDPTAPGGWTRTPSYDIRPTAGLLRAWGRAHPGARLVGEYDL